MSGDGKRVLFVDDSTQFLDLTQQIITAPSGRQVPFRVDGAKRRALLEGLEEIQMTLTLAGEIAGFQDSDRRRRPWIYRF